MKIIFPLLVSLLPLGVAAQSKLSPALQQQVQQLPTMRSDANAAIYDAYIYITDTDAVSQLRALGVQVGVEVGQFVTARIPADVLSSVADLPAVRYIDGALPARPMLDKARAASGTDNVLAGINLPQPYTGKGVIVGVVDAGFDYCHPAFRESDGTTPRIVRVWEQSYEQGTPPEGYSYGGELSTSHQILSAMGDVTSNSHGTHVAAIAAGRDCGNTWGGVAPDAEIVLVSKGAETTNNVNITDAVAYIFNYAKSQGKPCVVNLSLGMQTGPHDGTSPFDATLDALQGEGCVAVGSAGNFGADPIHVSARGGQTTQTFVDFKQRVSTATTGGSIDIWGSEGGHFTVQLALVNVSSGTVASSSDVIDASTTTGSSFTYTVTENAKGSATITTEINPLNNKPHALIGLNFTSKRSSYEFALIITPTDETTEVNAWADDVYVQFASNDKDGYVAGDTDLTLAEIGGTGKRIISVGAYTTRNEYTAAGSTSATHVDETLGEVASFSAAGPSTDGRTKPDVCAPGCIIISALSSNDANITTNPFAGHVTLDGTVYYWGYMQGTSMASPFVAGTVATWLQANPKLTPEDLRQVLNATCEVPTDVSAQNLNRWGRGKLQAYEGLKYVLSSTGINSPIATPAMAFTWQRNHTGNLSVLFATPVDHPTAVLYDVAGRRVASATAPAGSIEVTVPTAILPSGTYLLRAAGQTVKVVF